jgi:hypothetical protein
MPRLQKMYTISFQAKKKSNHKHSGEIAVTKLFDSNAQLLYDPTLAFLGKEWAKFLSKKTN